MGIQDCVYTDGIKDLLKECFNKDALYALASTATNNKILADNDREAVELILRYTDSLVKFFSYRRITSKVLFNYLHKKNVTTVKATDTKEELKDKVEKYWEEKSAAKCDRGTALVARPRETKDERSSLQPLKSSHLQHTHAHAHHSTSSSSNSSSRSSSSSSSNSSSGGNINGCINRTSSSSNISWSSGGGGGDLDIHLFSHKFCQWFYSMINGLQNSGCGIGGDVFSPDIFMDNSCMSVCLQGFQSEEKYTTSGPQETYDVFRNMCNKFGLIFMANSEFGVKGEVSEYGLIKVWCNGTLQVNNAMVGIFEQEFGVVKTVGEKWKIMMMKVNLKS